MASSRESDLNPQQLRAVHHTSSPLIILAGAGSGKTRTIVRKVIYYLDEKHVDPSQIVMITFTNKAAKEMKERIAQEKGANVSLGFAGTFHAFGARLLRLYGERIGIPRDFAIYDDGDSLDVMKSLVKRSQSKYSPRYFLSKISDAKNALLTPETFLRHASYYLASEVHEHYVAYEKLLRKNGAVDFDDLILLSTRLLQEDATVRTRLQTRHTHYLVDEFQDTNKVQYEMIKLLAGKTPHVTVVGDFSQSIYSWRGAEIKNLERFVDDFPAAATINLEENYRSTQEILQTAFDVISQNETHPILKLHTKNMPGDPIVYYQGRTSEDEAQFIAQKISEGMYDTPYADVAVLYRTNAQSRAIEEAFLHAGIPYVLIGGTRFYERREIKDVLSYLRLLLHPEDTVALDRVKKLGKRRFDRFRRMYEGIRTSVRDISTVEIMERIFAETEYLGMYDPDLEEDLARLENIKELKSVAVSFPDIVLFLEQVALVESEYFSAEKQKNRSADGVRLMTLHQAKGLEFPTVFISGLEEGILPHSRSLDDPFALEEERRLFYVGITRAMKQLVITCAARRMLYGRFGDSLPSRFLPEGAIPQEATDDEVWW